MAKKFTIELNTKPLWKASRGHSAYRGGAGKHDNRPRKLRTRAAQKKSSNPRFFLKKGLTVCRYRLHWGFIREKAR